VPTPSLVACNGEYKSELNVLETLLHEQPINQVDLNSNRTSEIQIIVLDGMTNRTGAKSKVIGRESVGKAEHMHFCPE
jgi:hypothetical protein